MSQTTWIWILTWLIAFLWADLLQAKPKKSREKKGQSTTLAQANDERPPRVRKSKKRAQDKPSDDEDTDDDEDAGPVTLSVPSLYVKKGYKLRLGDDLVDLDKNAIDRGFDGRLQRIDLLSNDGRLVDTEVSYLEESMIERLRPNTVRLAIYGGQTGVHGNAFSNLMMTGRMSFSSFDVVYQPEALGAILSVATIRNKTTSTFVSESLTSFYQSSQLRLGANYEIAPWYRTSGMMSRALVCTYLGLMYADHEASLIDSYLEITGKDSSYGIFGGAELRWPLASFFLGLRADWTLQQITIPDLGLDTLSVQRNLQVGISYAF